MAAAYGIPAKGKDLDMGGAPAPATEHKIRITLTGQDVTALEKGESRARVQPAGAASGALARSAPRRPRNRQSVLGRSALSPKQGADECLLAVERSPRHCPSPACSRPHHHPLPRPLQSNPAVCSDLKRQAEDNGLKGRVSGPVRLPTKTLHITTRKTPCGEGSKTWDRFEMRIHKRIIDLHASTDVVKKITAITIEPGVDVEVIVENSRK